MRLISLNVGMPKDVAWDGRTVHTGIWKYPVEGPRMVRKLNVDGDGQGDLGGHGGEMRAVLVYQQESYEYWQRHLGRDDLTPGRFGENFTVAGLADDEVCVGDRYRIGEAEFEVTQPRVTCFRVGMRLGVPDMPSLLVAHHRPGFYLRVIEEGHVRAGDEIVRTRRGPHAMTVADIDALLYLPNRDRAALTNAVDIPALSPGWQQSFHELLAAPVSVEPSWAGFRQLRVTDVVPESTTIASVYLAADEPLPPPLPGQYLTIRASDVASPAPVRSYSLSSDPAAGTYRISVKRESHGVVSGYLHTRLRVGAVLDVAAPRGEFVLEPGVGPVVLISAGVGVTPVLAMLHQLAATRSEREVWWLHAARNAREQAFAAEASELLSTLPNAHEHVFYSSERRLTAAALAELALPTDATAYICGPVGFMTDIEKALRDLGLAAVHTELFGARSAINPGLVDNSVVAPHQPPGPVGTGPSVTFARSGLTVRAGGTTLLELAESCDVPTRWSCRTGVCHTCVTPVLSGAVEYVREPLERPADGEALICCARPSADLVVDL